MSDTKREPAASEVAAVSTRKLHARARSGDIASENALHSDPADDALQVGVESPLELPFRAGDVLAGKYEVSQIVGVGGIAFVLAARHIGFDSFVALKFLRPELACVPEALARFTAEAQNNFRLESEHIVRVLDVDMLPRGLPFMVMELLHGQDLRSELAGGALSVARAVTFALQVAEALATAHASGVIHCDIKPENLFVLDDPARVDPWLKVLDFGISRALQGMARSDATAQMVSSDAIGSPPYMSPEQVRATPELDARTDIWSLGCVLYEMLTMRVPFGRATRTESCSAVLEQEPPALAVFTSDLPDGLQAVIDRCLRKDPLARFADVAEFAAALAPFAPERAQPLVARCRALLDAPRPKRNSTPRNLARISTPLPIAPRGSSPEAHVATQLMSEVTGSARSLRPRRRFGALATSALALLVAGGAFAALRGYPHLLPQGAPHAGPTWARGSLIGGRPAEAPTSVPPPVSAVVAPPLDALEPAAIAAEEPISAPVAPLARPPSRRAERSAPSAHRANKGERAELPRSGASRSEAERAPAAGLVSPILSDEPDVGF